MKIFISVPMTGRSNDEIKNHIEMIKKAANRYFVKTEVNFVDNFECDFEPERCVDLKHPRIGYLAESIKKLAYCDGIIFGNGYLFSSECHVEYCVAEEYGFDFYFEEDEDHITEDEFGIM